MIINIIFILFTIKIKMDINEKNNIKIAIASALGLDSCYDSDYSIDQTLLSNNCAIINNDSDIDCTNDNCITFDKKELCRVAARVFGVVTGCSTFSSKKLRCNNGLHSEFGLENCPPEAPEGGCNSNILKSIHNNISCDMLDGIVEQFGIYMKSYREQMISINSTIENNVLAINNINFSLIDSIVKGKVIINNNLRLNVYESANISATMHTFATDTNLMIFNILDFIKSGIDSSDTSLHDLIELCKEFIQSEEYITQQIDIVNKMVGQFNLQNLINLEYIESVINGDVILNQNMYVDIVSEAFIDTAIKTANESDQFKALQGKIQNDFYTLKTYKNDSFNYKYLIIIGLFLCFIGFFVYKKRYSQIKNNF